MKIIENKRTGATLIRWKELKEVQPDNLKIKENREETKASIVELGFADPFDVWVNPKTNEKLIIDGHGRKEILIELIEEGYDVPEELPCTFLDNTQIKTQKQAMIYFFRVHNSKRNKMDGKVAESWIEEFDLSLDDVAFEELDIKFETDDIEVEKLDTVEEEEKDKNKEIDIDNIDTSECKIVFKFDAIMYESITQRIRTIQQEEGLNTNEAVLLKLLECYGA